MRKSKNHKVSQPETERFAALNLTLSLICCIALRSSIGFVDLQLAGELGTQSQAAVGLGEELLSLLLVLGTAITTALSSLIARAGIAGFAILSKSGLVMALSTGSLAAIALLLLNEALLGMLGVTPELKSLVAAYTVSSAPANITYLLMLVQTAIFRSSGMLKESMYTWLIAASASNLLSIALLHSGIPQLHSIISLSIAWDLGSFLAATYAQIKLWKLLRMTDRTASPEMSLRQALHSLLQLALPIAACEISGVIYQFMIYQVLSQSSKAICLQAAWTIKMKVEELLLLVPLLALGNSAALVVGEKTGENNRKGAIRFCLHMAASSSLLTFCSGALLSLSAETLTKYLSPDPDTQKALSILIAPSVVYFPLAALNSIICSGLEGSGNSFLPFVFRFLFQLVLRLTLAQTAFLLQQKFLEGIAVSVCLSELLMSAAILLFLAERRRKAHKNSPDHESREPKTLVGQEAWIGS